MAYQYAVSVGASATGPWTLFNQVAVTTDTVTGLASGTTYFFQIIVTDLVTGIVSTPIVAGPFTTTAVVTESPAGTTVTTSSQTITSSQTPGQAAPINGPFDTWSITGANGQVVHNTSPDPNTGNIIELYYLNHFVYQEANAANSLGLNPGWWQWTGGTTGNGFGWTDSQDPRPTGPTVTISTIPTEALGTPFGVSGLLQNYSAAPTLQYNDNGGAFVALPTGSTVSSKNFSFTHPAVTTANASMTVGVRDANSTSVSATSNTFSVSTPTITGISLSGSKTVSSGVAPPQTVGTITVQFTGGSFSGQLDLTGTDAASFTIGTGNQLQTAANLTARTYNFSIRATQTGASGSPFVQPEQIVAQSGPAVGPSATGNFINADFTNLTSPNGVNNVIVHPQLFGVASSGIHNHWPTSNDVNFNVCNNATFQSLVTALAPPLFRLHSEWSTTASNLSPLATNASKIFPADCTMMIGVSYTSSASYKSVSDFWSANGTVPASLFEVGNETGQSPSSYQTSFNTAVSGIQATSSTYRLGGPAYAGNPGAGWWSSFIGNSANSTSTVGFLSWHEYEWCLPVQGAITPTNTQCCLAQNANSPGGTRNFAMSDVQDIQSATSGTWAANTPMFLGEYSIECSADSDMRMGSSIAVPFLMSTLLGGASVSTQPLWAGIWDLVDDGGDNYNIIDTQLNTLPSYYGLQKLTQTMPGQMVNTSPGNSANGCVGYATKNGINFGLAIVNPNGTAQSGQVGLSHWPLNSSGNATIHIWTYPTSPGLSSGGSNTGVSTVLNTPGTTTTVTVTAGLTAQITVPAFSGAILFP